MKKTLKRQKQRGVYSQSKILNFQSEDICQRVQSSVGLKKKKSIIYILPYSVGHMQVSNMLIKTKDIIIVMQCCLACVATV